MSDKQTETYDLKIDLVFVDGDTRTITLKNPKTQITTEEIRELETLMLNENGETLLVGDKYGSALSKITKVAKITQTTTTLDIGT